MAERLSELIAAVRLPHHAPSTDGDGLRVDVEPTAVLVGGRRLGPQLANDLSRAVRAALVARCSRTVRPGGGQAPLMVCRIGDHAVRVDGQWFTRAAGIQLAVALDIAAAQVRDRLEAVVTRWVTSEAETSYMLS
ncbi:hypothetical protein [Micromonospora sp. NPDC005652]|uniref:hypothetical protein n=1 Tax=Micromonospora sp. NPDC005652 TaxID=3157046 RepID=UPI0033E5A994